MIRCLLCSFNSFVQLSVLRVHVNALAEQVLDHVRVAPLCRHMQHRLVVLATVGQLAALAQGEAHVARNFRMYGVGMDNVRLIKG